MIHPKDLQWGQTPFDDMTREELLDELKAHHCAVQSASSALHMLSYDDRDSPFWGPDGTGGRGKMQVDSIIARVNHNRDDGCERISRCYFRYADAIHFPDITSEDRHWWINGDGQMTTGGPAKGIAGWKDDWRPLTKDDLKPLPADDSAVSAE